MCDTVFIYPPFRPMEVKTNPPAHTLTRSAHPVTVPKGPGRIQRIVGSAPAQLPPLTIGFGASVWLAAQVLVGPIIDTTIKSQISGVKSHLVQGARRTVAPAPELRAILRLISGIGRSD